MKQYHAIKAKYPGALLLFRVGDFYETFGEDAITASRILDIVLTRRSNGAASEVELAGFPHHSLETYLPRLVRAGQRVAICDQLEDPKQAKGIVKRGVTELVTPGVSFNDHVLNVRQNNYLAALYAGPSQTGVAFLDVSTGEFMAAQGPRSYVEKLLQSFQPSEVIYAKGQKKLFDALTETDYNPYRLDDWVFAPDYAYEKLTRHFGTATLKGFGIEGMLEAIIAAGAALYYLEMTEHHQLGHISAISRIEEEHYVWLDKFTIRNLELIAPQHENGVPLLQVLDHTVTPMGARLLKKWLVLPLKLVKAIEERLDVVESLCQAEEVHEKLTDLLRPVGDLERLISKVAAGRVTPREMAQLRKALRQVEPLQTLLASHPVPAMQKAATQLNGCQFLLEKMERELAEQPPVQLQQGGVMKDGISPELDELRKMAHSGKEYLLGIQQREIERTGISSLKISYNKVFGYYLEVRNTHQEKVPKDWIRKQTLVNAERYITEELKDYEEKILHAEDRMLALETRLFQELVSATADFTVQIQQNAVLMAKLDALSSFATAARQHRYMRPILSEGHALLIKDGRHPVIERQLPPGEEYVPNDLHLDDQEQQILVITGPNMAGKSALLRQTALIVLMAQAGCFVPATEAHIGLVDKIFTRVGASDNLSKGESTFMVEMTETASILNNLSSRSLILMDEIGRGTSTYDGISIAWAIVEYLHNHADYRPRTLFATHYHELNQLAEQLPRVRNFNVSVKEAGNKVIFLRKLKPGGSEHSFGIHVAQMAGMPNRILLRSGEILTLLEKDKSFQKRKERMQELPPATWQLNLFQAADPNYQRVSDLLKALDINTISPVEALLKLNEIKTLMGGK